MASQGDNKWVYSFGAGKTEGRADMKNLLGGKGANLAEMANLGLPVPPGFTITTEVCTYFYANGKSYPPELKDQVAAALSAIEEAMGAHFGDPANPLLVSDRPADSRTFGWLAVIELIALILLPGLFVSFLRRRRLAGAAR